jgi:hypothetical protein
MKQSNIECTKIYAANTRILFIIIFIIIIIIIINKNPICSYKAELLGLH